jgi:hypothetical protein
MASNPENRPPLDSQCHRIQVKTRVTIEVTLPNQEVEYIPVGNPPEPVRQVYNPPCIQICVGPATPALLTGFEPPTLTFNPHMTVNRTTYEFNPTKVCDGFLTKTQFTPYATYMTVGTGTSVQMTDVFTEDEPAESLMTADTQSYFMGDCSVYAMDISVSVQTSEIVLPTILIHDFVHYGALDQNYDTLNTFGTDVSNPSINKLFPGPVQFRHRHVDVNVIRPLELCYSCNVYDDFHTGFSTSSPWTRQIRYSESDSNTVLTDPKQISFCVLWPGCKMPAADCLALYENALGEMILPETSYTIGTVIVETTQYFVCYPSPVIDNDADWFPFDRVPISNWNTSAMELSAMCKELRTLRRFQISEEMDEEEDGLVW